MLKLAGESHLSIIIRPSFESEEKYEEKNSLKVKKNGKFEEMLTIIIL